MPFSTIFKSLVIVLFICQTNSSFAQRVGPSKDKDWRIEIEPASLFLNGISGSVMYTISQNNAFSLGIFGATLNIPDQLKPNMFNHVGPDTSQVRLGFELAVNARYKLNIFKKLESNPYVGLIVGWEYFDIQQPSFSENIRLSTYLLTPYVGYEFYVYRQMLYLNPQIRSVFYLSPVSNFPFRNESLQSTFVLPQISVGVRL